MYNEPLRKGNKDFNNISQKIMSTMCNTVDKPMHIV